MEQGRRVPVFPTDPYEPFLVFFGKQGYHHGLCAPMSSSTSTEGLNHGIVGGDNDVDRAVSMMEEACNWTGAPRIVPLTPDVLELISDNPDLSILHVGMKAELKKEIVHAALRRNSYHGVLIWVAVVLDVVKGPKKGTWVKTFAVLSERCYSLAKQMLDKAAEAAAANHPQICIGYKRPNH